MQDINQFKAAFFEECEDLFEQMEEAIGRLTEAGDPTEAIDSAFRAVHSMKGGAGMFGFARIVGLAHAMESALVEARGRRVGVDAAFVGVMLHAADILYEVASAARSGVALREDFETECFDQLATLAIAGRHDTAQRTAAANAKRETQPRSVTTYAIRYQPSADIFRRGQEPLLLIRSLGELGELESSADVDRLPDFAELDPAVAYLSWTFRLTTQATLADVEEIFEFASPNCRIDIEPIAVAEDAVEAHDSSAAAVEAGAQDLSPAAARASIRVDLDRIDRLVNAVGEISIVQSMVLQHLDQTIVDANPQLYRSLTQLLQLTRSLQDGVMSIRAQPIRSVFSRMPRVVREAAHATGKKARLELAGEATEIDKTIIEQLSDPLMHIVRNAIDHGIEAPSARVAAGKPETGVVRLEASQRGGRIVIEISDDGRGIDRGAVVRRATDLGIIDADADLADQEIDNLVFRAGLSTAETVSDLSGRGVGMDVVLRNIQALGGRVSIRSEAGRGATTTIVLPLTLAILDSMLVRCGREFYLAPLASILECVVAPRQGIRTVPGAGQFFNVRGRQTPVFELAERLGVGRDPAGERAAIVLVECAGRGPAGIIVDEICGHRQVVIKSVQEHFESVPGLAGATILGDGRVAFILDVDDLAARGGNDPLRRGGASELEEAHAA